MNWKQRALDLLDDAKRYAKQAVAEWGEAIQDDPVQHALSFAAGAVLAIGVWSVF